MSFISSQWKPPLSRSKSISVRLNREPSLSTSSTYTSAIYFNPKLKRTIDSISSNAPVDLSYRNLVDDDLLVIVKSVINEKRCPALSLCGNRLTFRSACIPVSHLSNNRTLHLLDLSYNHLCDGGTRTISDMLSSNRCAALQKLILSKNGVSNEGAGYLADMLRTNRSIKELHLSSNEIGNRGVEQLANALAYRNKTLKVLVLSFNIFITDSCINDLMKIFKYNQTLERLSITDCNLSATGKSKINEQAYRKTKFHLDVWTLDIVSRSIRKESK